jgi:hypothetical protein
MSEDWQEYRNDLAKEITETPKDSRREVLHRAKSSEEYWEANTRKSKVVEEPTEELLDDGKTVLIHKKTLYHGSSLNDISDFQPAEETTIGDGLYTTSEAKDAIGYARIRASARNGEPVIYEVGIDDKRLLDLRSSKNVIETLEGFRSILLDKLKSVKPDAPWYIKSGYFRSIEELDKIVDGEKSAGNLKDVVSSCGDVFSSYLESLGYDGLIFLEGGEGGDGGPGNHDSYLIFDPSKAKVLREHKIV